MKSRTLSNDNEILSSLSEITDKVLSKAEWILNCFGTSDFHSVMVLLTTKDTFEIREMMEQS